MGLCIRVPVFLAVGLLLGGCAGVPDCDYAAPPIAGVPVATPLPQSGRLWAPIPAGYIGFCLRYSDQCELPKNQAAILTLSQDNWGLLNRVNHDINRSISYEEDGPHYGIEDYWTIASDGYGDCEDFALTKRKVLLEAGLPAGALRIAVVLTQAKERHAILTVATDRGDYVLDSLSDQVRPWTDSNYVWLERQDAKERWAWDRLKEDTTTGQAVGASKAN
jgi:predicted transglutaminase-like cysteine proteinase